MTLDHDGRADFDFIHGRWQVRNRRLADVLDQSCTEWVEFDASSAQEPILGGLGNIDRYSAARFPSGQPLEGFTLRTFDPSTGLWRIWWTSTSRPGEMDPPVVGRFVDGVGEFVCDDVIGGVAVEVKFRWDRTTTDSPRWSQAFSYDSGASWEWNWTMEFTRDESSIVRFEAAQPQKESA